ncbi:uncharacterized protein LOC119682824 [Teleopsis dalmanni]|uniref:uncharacterized protein LOC119682824 n=1 Tax=Teleopsis dalmanni TaxID=139649 RepID=UPI0018CC934E|nr:uncharacterized protein LOC119682824 [Teleopsis dalmanni]
MNKYLEGINMNIKFGGMIQKPKLMLTLYSVKNDQPDFIIVNVTNIDGCQFLEGNGGLLNLLQIIRKQFAKYSNIPKRCPVAKHTEIYVKDLHLEADSFPPYMPESKYNIEVKLWEQTTPVLELLINGTVEYKNRRTF